MVLKGNCSRKMCLIRVTEYEPTVFLACVVVLQSLSVQVHVCLCVYVCLGGGGGEAHTCV